MNTPRGSPLPPKWLDKLLEQFCPDELLEEVQGDLHERYYLRLEKMGEKKARQLYFTEVMVYMRPSILKRRTTSQHSYFNLLMLQHNLLLIYRNFKRFKSTFFINLIGLSTGLACTLLIYLWVNDELSFDKFHQKDSQLYQVMRTSYSNEIGTGGITPGILAEALARDMPEVEYATSAGINLPETKTLSVNKEHAIKSQGFYAGKDFFNIFSFPLIAGDKERVLTDPNSIVISEGLAMRLFGSTSNVVGKTLEYNHEKQYQISGVFQEAPANSSIQFDFVLSHDILLKSNPGMSSWNNNYTVTFLILKEGTDIDQFNKKIAGLIKSNHKESTAVLFVKPFSDNYLYGKYENGLQAGGRITYVQLFSTIAIFILVIACINFMNLSTAKASRRLKEVGIKKAIGAARQTLVTQYLGESLLMTFISLIIAVLLVVLLLPQFNEVTGKELALSFEPGLIIAFFLITIFTGLIAGSYPALYLSGFSPITVLKGKMNTSVGEVWARKGLVVFQFALSILFIVAVLVVYKQIEFVQNRNLGYNKDNVIYFEREGWAKTNLDAFLAEVNKVPGVVNSSSLLMNFVGPAGALNNLDWPGKNPNDKIDFEYRIVNYDFIETLDIEMAAGRPFSREFAKGNAKIVFNEAAIEVMGIKDPIGKIVKFQGDPVEIIGVTKNFHFESLHEKVRPLFFFLAPDYTGLIMVKIAAGKEKETIDRLAGFYGKYNPGFTFEYKFLDADYQAQYAAEKRVSVLSKYFAGLAILISCLGLFGLATFTAERRRKEIGIRKVLGSTEMGIVYLLSGEFTKMVLMAVCIALPVSYLLTKQWLDNFAFSIDLQWWYFVGAGLAALLIAWLTVGMQAVKASRINPIQSLRDE